jgi:hypothetical protein
MRLGSVTLETQQYSKRREHAGFCHQRKQSPFCLGERFWLHIVRYKGNIVYRLYLVIIKMFPGRDKLI